MKSERVKRVKRGVRRGGGGERNERRVKVTSKRIVLLKETTQRPALKISASERNWQKYALNDNPQ